MNRPFALLASLIARDGVAALVSVVAARGSTPREAGARMVVSRAGDIAGTIGGGRLELEAIAAATAAMAAPRDGSEIRPFALGPALGQCCGGHVTLLLETITAATDLAPLVAAEATGPFATEATAAPGEPVRRRILGPASAPATAAIDGGTLREVFGRPTRPVLLFGAGHVGRALVLALAPLPVSVTWVDARADMFPTAVPANVRLVATDRPETLAADAPEACLLLVMTHDHAVDLDIIHAALRHGRCGYVGLIGSATKRARFESRLKALGLPPAAAESFRCPIGVQGIASKEPALISVAVAAELMIEDQWLRAATDRPAARPLIAAVGDGRTG